MTQAVSPAPTVLDCIRQVIKDHPHLRLPETEELLRWPLYGYAGGSVNDELRAILRLWAHEVRVPFYERLEDLSHVNGLLNTTATNALISGIIWLREEQRGTPQVRRIGLTFHPLVAAANIHLIHPEDWHALLARVFPRMKLEYGDAPRTVSLTVERDQANYDLLTAPMRRAVLRLERGIESGAPQHAHISTEAQLLISESFQREHHVIPFRYEKDQQLLHVFMTDVDDAALIARIGQFTKAQIKPYYMEQDDEEEYWLLRRVVSFARDQEADQMRQDLLDGL